MKNRLHGSSYNCAINFIPVNLFLAVMIISEWKPVYWMASIVNSMFNWYEIALHAGLYLFKTNVNILMNFSEIDRCSVGSRHIIWHRSMMQKMTVMKNRLKQIRLVKHESYAPFYVAYGSINRAIDHCVKSNT